MHLGGSGGQVSQRGEGIRLKVFDQAKMGYKFENVGI
ncbi:hypothetical protein BCL90_0685 [Pedobacter alluvionis]|uniref:Uncharacterized protein n=1 Tax=Pedobacter alluvionis TaxID=475253 RepID=A0A497YBU9_9SPHI|nr:hypothetical protein BCL90_0685 [Pedobacter alluvionis]